MQARLYNELQWLVLIIAVFAFLFSINWLITYSILWLILKIMAVNLFNKFWYVFVATIFFFVVFKRGV